MSSIREIARKIPDNVRSKILITEEDPILNASANVSNPQMKLLAEIWCEFIEPQNKVDNSCPICLNNILTSFRQMKADLIELEKDYRQLNSI